MGNVVLRFRYRLLVLAVGVACAKEPAAPDDAVPEDTGTSEETGDTGTVVAPDVGSASCALSASNPLRVECTATLLEAGAAVLELSAAGVPARRFTSAGPTLDHELLGWGLKPETTYDWQIGGITGQVTTGSLDPELAGASIVVTGDAGGLGFDAILQPLGCARMWMVMIDPDGDIVWYEPNDVYGIRSNGYEWAPDDRSVLSINGDTLLETHVSGAELLRLQRGTHFDAGLHHDLTRWGPYTYVLFEERVNTQNVDGIYVFEGTQQVGRFFLGDHYTVPSVGMGDWSHANGLNAGADGELVMSLHTFSSVLGIDGDPASAGFLDITWMASGTGGGLPNPTYVPPAGAREGFGGQHNAARIGNELWLFDNTGVSSRSRGARYELDDGAGEVRLTAEWELERSCPVQGGAIPVDGGVVVTCSNAPIVLGFELAETDPAWTLQATCSSASDTMIRGIPIDIR